jgi:hypothetical protein
MSEKNPIRIFVTHAFTGDADYHRVFEYLESSPNFFYKNTSAPDRAPTGGGKEALKDELRAQIKDAEIVVVLASFYESNDVWATYEMDAAQAMDIPIVAIGFFGRDDKLPDVIAKRAATVVQWNERELIDAVRRIARHEQTNRWEVIEFTPD